MDITVNRAVLSSILNKDKLKDEIAEFLNGIIDAELEKENADDKLIDECVEILYELDVNGAQAALKSVSKNTNIIRFCHDKTQSKTIKLRRRVAIALAAAIIATTMLAAGPALAEQVKEFFYSVAESLNLASDKTAEKDTDVRALYAKYDELDATVKNESDIDLSGIEIFAVYDNGEKAVPLADCEVTKQRGVDGDSSKILVIVSYRGCAFSIIFTVEE